MSRRSLTRLAGAVTSGAVACSLHWASKVRAESRESNYKGVFGGGLGFGKKPAIVVVDFVKAYVTEGSALHCPDPEIGVQRAIDFSYTLIRKARESNVPIVFTKVLYNPSMMDGGVFVQKIPVLQTMTVDNPLTDIVPELQPLPQDTVIVKQYPSAFFGTPLAAMLTAHAVDTVILVGCSTSGCIRASALDGMQHGFRIIVPRECVGDRLKEVHDANLFDINAKNGDVMTLEAVIGYIESLSGQPKKARGPARSKEDQDIDMMMEYASKKNANEKPS